MTQVIATPVSGARVRKPDGLILLEKGERVEKSAYWVRREKDGDVSLTPLDGGAPQLKKPKGKGD
jgi:hypothetical protein